MPGKEISFPDELSSANFGMQLDVAISAKGKCQENNLYSSFLLARELAKSFATSADRSVPHR